jgi:hypothetical protein
MSAVVLSLATPLSSVIDSAGNFAIKEIPPGTYKATLWIEGVPQPTLDSFGRTLRISSGLNDLGTLKAPLDGTSNDSHTNKFGHPYDRDSKPTY